MSEQNVSSVSLVFNEERDFCGVYIDSVKVYAGDMLDAEDLMNFLENKVTGRVNHFNTDLLDPTWLDDMACYYPETWEGVAPDLFQHLRLSRRR